MQGARVFQSPSRYQQCQGLIGEVGGAVLSTFPSLKKPSIVMSKRARNSPSGLKLIESFSTLPEVYEYDSECSKAGVKKVVKAFQASGVDHVVSFGGGKIVDVGKLVADQLQAKSIVVPSVASTDAPCTALSVLYTDEGLFDEYVFFNKSPDMVLVDTEIILESPLRFLVSGMGDALSTFYEARACSRNPKASSLISPFTYRPPGMALAISQKCRDILFEHGIQALNSSKSKVLDSNFDAVVEACILMSGLGAESGGLAAAHAIHNALNELPESHASLHGEKVAFGTICQLFMEGDDEEAAKVVSFCKQVGLPTKFIDMNIDITTEKLEIVARHCLDPTTTVWNVGPHITRDLLIQSMVKANALGASLKG